uniref:Putative secreted protein n=1 Tax=Anopheles darlingi TaxID=43151 RepID=A0A2M4DH75_ANODA
MCCHFISTYYPYLSRCLSLSLSFSWFFFLCNCIIPPSPFLGEKLAKRKFVVLYSPSTAIRPEWRNPWRQAPVQCHYSQCRCICCVCVCVSPRIYVIMLDIKCCVCVPACVSTCVCRCMSCGNQ